jgi:hypothetical protein
MLLENVTDFLKKFVKMEVQDLNPGMESRD